MHIEEMAYAVPGTMQEVHVVLPYRHAGQYIQLRSSRTFREDSHGEVDMSFQYRGVVRLLLRSVSSAMVRVMSVVPSRYCAPESSSRNPRVSVARPLPEWLRSVRWLHVPCIRQWCRSFPHVEWLCGTEFVQFLVYADFCLVACGNGLLQPFQNFTSATPSRCMAAWMPAISRSLRTAFSKAIGERSSSTRQEGGGQNKRHNSSFPCRA